MQNFINDKGNEVKQVNLSGNITDNSFSGPNSWIYFDRGDSEKILKWFDKVIIDENIDMASKVSRY